jgi:hypothetical protein
MERFGAALAAAVLTGRIKALLLAHARIFWPLLWRFVGRVFVYK